MSHDESISLEKTECQFSCKIQFQQSLLHFEGIKRYDEENSKFPV